MVNKAAMAGIDRVVPPSIAALHGTVLVDVCSKATWAGMVLSFAMAALAGTDRIFETKSAALDGMALADVTSRAACERTVRMDVCSNAVEHDMARVLVAFNAA